ncbi:hypothetical protein [Oerskovia turbata]
MPPADHVSAPDGPGAPGASGGPEARGPAGARRPAGPGEQDSPAARPAPRRRPRRVVRPGTEQAGVAGLGADDDAAAWGDVRPGAAADARDAEFLRDVPPHWS